MTMHPLHPLGFEPIAPAPATGPVPGSQGGSDKMVKGTKVRLAYGALGRVVYVDPNLRIARVRTEDGRTSRCAANS